MRFHALYTLTSQLYTKQKRFSESQEQLEKALKLAEALSDKIRLAELEAHLAALFTKQEKTDLAKKHFINAINYIQPTDRTNLLLDILLEIAEFLNLNHQTQLAEKLNHLIVTHPQTRYSTKKIAFTKLKTKLKNPSTESLEELIEEALEVLSQAEAPVQKNALVLSDDQWQNIRALLPPQPEKGRKRKQDKEVINSFYFMLKTNKVYNDLPNTKDYAAPNTARRWLEFWRKEGILNVMEQHLSIKNRN